MLRFIQSQLSFDNLLGDLMRAAILTLLGWIWSRFWKSQAGNKRNVFLWLVAIPLTIVILQWTVEYSISVHNRPEFHGSIKALGIGTSGDNQTAAIAVEIWIDNAGTPSIVREWSCWIETPTGEKWPGQIAPFTANITLGGQNSTNVIPTSSSITYKSVETPIQFGGSMAGVLSFMVPNVNKSVVEEHGNKVFVSFTDVTGRKYVISIPVGTASRPM